MESKLDYLLYGKEGKPQKFGAGGKAKAQSSNITPTSNIIAAPNSGSNMAAGIGGGLLSGAGTGATIGSFAGPVGTAIGAGVGGLAGAVTGAFGAAQKNDAQRDAHNASNENAQLSQLQQLTGGLRGRK
jgi:phage tail tape-measure protein